MKQWTPSKAEWAAAKARDLRSQAAALSGRQPNWRQAQRTRDAQSRLYARAARLQRLVGEDWTDTPF